MCSNCVASLNTDKAEAFAQQMIGTLNQAAIAMMCSIGHRTGLFDALSETENATSQSLADKAGLNERYVREWLGALTTGGIIEHDGDAGTYWLPAEHAAFLTRAVGSDNIAQTTQWISVLGAVETEVVNAFKDGAGVPYASYDRFHEVMADESALTVVAGLQEHILPLVPGLTEKLEEGIEVLDVGCGFGRAMQHLAERFPNSKFKGYDFSEEAIDAATREAGEKGLSNVIFEVKDAATFEDSDTYDLICTFDSVHDQAKPDAMLSNMARALKDDGVYICQDIQGSSSHAGDMGHPIAPFIYTISCMHCMSVSLANNGAGLGAAWGKKTAVKMMNDAGFNNVDVNELEHDFINYYYVARKTY